MPMTPRPNLGPLTTTFTAPKRCAKAVLAPTAPPLPPPPPPGGRGGARLAQTCYKDHAMDDAACWPSPNKGAATPAAAALGGWGVYTPGLVCPDSYTTACSATAGVKGGFDFQFGLEAGETAVGCCPSGYGCHQAITSGKSISTVVQTCTSYATKGTFAAATCHGNDSVVVTQPVSSQGAPLSSAGFLVGAPLIQIAWRSSDLAPNPTCTSPSPGKKTAAAGTAPTTAARTYAGPSTYTTYATSFHTTTTASAVASAAADAADTSSASGFPALSADETPSGLSMGVAVGIGMSAALLALVLTAVAMFLASRRRQKRDADAPSETEAVAAAATDPVLDFKAFRYGPSVEVPGSYGTGYGLDVPEKVPVQEAGAQGRVQGQFDSLEREQAPNSVAGGQPRELDYLFDRLYEEVRGGPRARG